MTRHIPWTLGKEAQYCPTITLIEDAAAFLQPKPASQQGMRTVYQSPGCEQGLKRVSSLIACPPGPDESPSPQEFRQKQELCG